MGVQVATTLFGARSVGVRSPQSTDVPSAGSGSITSPSARPAFGKAVTVDSLLERATRTLQTRLKEAMAGYTGYVVLSWRNGVATVRRDVAYAEAVQVDTINGTCTCCEHAPAAAGTCGGIVTRQRNELLAAGHGFMDLLAANAWPQCKHELIVAALQAEFPDRFVEHGDAVYPGCSAAKDQGELRGVDDYHYSDADLCRDLDAIAARQKTIVRRDERSRIPVNAAAGQVSANLNRCTCTETTACYYCLFEADRRTSDYGG